MLSNLVLKFFQGGLKQYCGTQWLNIVELFNKCSASALSDVDLILTENVNGVELAQGPKLHDQSALSRK